MAHSYQAGFSLFPMPPTPPANKQRALRIARDQQYLASEALPNHQSPSQRHASKVAQAQLRPAPLKLRKKRPTQLNHVPRQQGLRVVNPDPQSPGDSISQLPLQVQRSVFAADEEPDSPTLRVPPTPVCSPTLGRDFPSSWPALPVEAERPVTHDDDYQPPLKRRSYRASQWLGPNGQIDRKKLSVYLNKVLDSSFAVIDGPDCDDLLSSPTFRSPQLGQGQEWGGRRIDAVGGHPRHWPGDASYAGPYSRRPEDTRIAQQFATKVPCGCPPGVVMCQSCSSEEFEQFRRRQADHKPNASVSSTKCNLAVPRARFRTPLADVQEPETPSSPPDLMYDSEASEESDWSLPSSPTDASSPAPSVQATPTPAPRSSVVPRAMARPNAVSRPNVPSFSLPFTHGRQITPRIMRDPTNPAWGSQSPSCASPASTVPTLASISTISTFTFDFNKADDETEYDPFDEGSEISEIRTYEPIQKAKPVLVHCRGPSPQSIKYGLAYSYRSPRSPRLYQTSEDSGYSALYV